MHAHARRRPGTFAGAALASRQAEAVIASASMIHTSEGIDLFGEQLYSIADELRHFEQTKRLPSGRAFAIEIDPQTGARISHPV